jgi:hypothetical protein
MLAIAAALFGALPGLLAGIPFVGPFAVAIATAIGTVAGKIVSNKWALIALASILALGAADLHGRRAANAKCELRILNDRHAAVAAAKKRDRQIAAALARKYEPVIAQLRTESDTLQKQVDQYARKESEKPKPAACELGGAAAVQLRAKRR